MNALPGIFEDEKGLAFDDSRDPLPQRWIILDQLQPASGFTKLQTTKRSPEFDP